MNKWCSSRSITCKCTQDPLYMPALCNSFLLRIMLLWARRKDAGCDYFSSFTQHLLCSGALPLCHLGGEHFQQGEWGMRRVLSLKNNGVDKTRWTYTFQSEDQCYFSEVRRWTILGGRFSALTVFHCGNPNGIHTFLPSMISYGLQSAMKLSPCLTMGDDGMSYWHMDVKCTTNIRTKAFRQA